MKDTHHQNIFHGIKQKKDRQKMVLEIPEPHSWEQNVLMKAFITPGLLELWCACGTKFGKALNITEFIPTINGFTKLEDIRKGDFVFDENGAPTEVLWESEIMYNHKCYEVVFQDGAKVVADMEHLWQTQTHKERKNEARNKSGVKYNKIRTTQEIKDTLHTTVSGVVRPNHSIPTVTSPVRFRSKKLPIDPYVLGLWLGDGSSNSGLLTLNKEQSTSAIDKIRKDGNIAYQVKDSKHEGYGAIHLRIKGLTRLLNENGLINNKHIPSRYLVGSRKQRLDLLRGLMDSDGTISKYGDCCFDNTNKNLTDGVTDLAMSLGIKVNRSERIGKLYGVEKKRCYRAWFTTDIEVFCVEQKLQRLRPVNKKAKNRYIVAINEVPSVPVKCIKVANPSSLFLVGKACIPTHNTLGAAGGQAGGAWVKDSSIYRWVAPIYSQSKYGLRYHQNLLPKNSYEVNKSEPSLTLLKNNTRIEYRSAKNPEEMEGEGVSGGYCLDEAAKMTRQAYDSAKTTVTLTRAPIAAFSTPKGKNWFFHKCMEAKEEMEWCIQNGKPPTKIFLTAPTASNPNVPRESIAEAKLALPERLYRQYYLSEFLDDGSVFIGYRECIFGEKVDLWGHIQEWIVDSPFDCDVVMGVDWAKKDDFTVITAIDFTGEKPRVVGFCRFQGLSYIEAVKILMRFAKNFKEIHLVQHDRTGVGEALDDILAASGLPCEGVVFSNQSKTGMVNQLMLTFERRELLIPNIQVLLGEIELYEVEATPSGLMRYSAPEGFHDDCISSLMLANSACKELRGGFEIRILEDLPKTELTIDKFYAELRQEAEDEL